MSKVLHSFYTSLWEPQPPSVNEMYTTFRGKRVLTKKGRAFHDALRQRVVEATAPLPWKTAIEDIYVRHAHTRLVIVLHMDILNKSWTPGGKTPKGELQSPYKKKDASSYIKVIEDAVVKGTGIDDSCAMNVEISKFPSEVPFVEVAFEVIGD